MRRVLAASLICAVCGACEMRRADSRREIAPAELLVREPASVSAGLGIGPQPLLQAPPVVADGSEARPFPTLSAALQVAPAGAFLRIAEGIWRERLTILRPVVLMGRGARRTRIVPP